MKNSAFWWTLDDPKIPENSTWDWKPGFMPSHCRSLATTVMVLAWNFMQIALCNNSLFARLNTQKNFLFKRQTSTVIYFSEIWNLPFRFQVWSLIDCIFHSGLQTLELIRYVVELQSYLSVVWRKKIFWIRGKSEGWIEEKTFSARNKRQFGGSLGARLSLCLSGVRQRKPPVGMTAWGARLRFVFGETKFY